VIAAYARRQLYRGFKMTMRLSSSYPVVSSTSHPQQCKSASTSSESTKTVPVSLTHVRILHIEIPSIRAWIIVCCAFVHILAHQEVKVEGIVLIIRRRSKGCALLESCAKVSGWKGCRLRWILAWFIVTWVVGVLFEAVGEGVLGVDCCAAVPVVPSHSTRTAGIGNGGGAGSYCHGSFSTGSASTECRDGKD